MAALQHLLDTFRVTTKTEREKGTYCEPLVKTCLRHEPYYSNFYAGRVWLWEEWRAMAARADALFNAALLAWTRPSPAVPLSKAVASALAGDVTA
jgi:predicted helicase